jgi:hypothetical protein
MVFSEKNYLSVSGDFPWNVSTGVVFLMLSSLIS